MKSVARAYALPRLARAKSDGYTFSLPHMEEAWERSASQAWNHHYNVELEAGRSSSTKADEDNSTLFGHCDRTFVSVVKSTDPSCKVEADRRMLWEKAVYAQVPDLRNDWTHHNAQNVIKSHRQGRDVMQRFADAESEYAGWYPEEHANSPGQFWKELNSKNLYTHMVQEQEIAREMERYGGEFGVPTDDYQAHKGCPPLLSPQTYEFAKYHLHEEVVRALNAATDGGKPALDDMIRFPADKATQAHAVAHQALTYFIRSVRPHGGVLRPEFEEVINQNFGGRAAFEAQVVSQARSAEGDATVWVTFHPPTQRLEVITCGADDAPQLHKLQPVAALVLREELWSRDYDSAEEFAERYVKALDYDQLYAQFCHWAGAMRPEPLVF